MELRLYFDEDAAYDDRIRALRAASFDVLTPVEAGMLGRSDRAQLTFAVSDERVLVSHNVGHFAALHREYLTEVANTSGSF